MPINSTQLTVKHNNINTNYLSTCTSQIHYGLLLSNHAINRDEIYHVYKLSVVNSFATRDEQVFNSVKEWIHSLKKFSTLISQSGEMQRIKFFKMQREIVEGLCV